VVLTTFCSAEEALELALPGSAVAVGGMHMTSAPMSLVREVVRQRIPIQRLITSPSSSLQADLLIGVGLVEEVVTPYIGFEHLGLAPCFRRAVEDERLSLLECDEAGLTHALYAGAGGLPFVGCPNGIELTDIPRVCPELYREVDDPFTGERRWVVRALRADIALLACREADEQGNVALGRFPFTDRLMALGARRVIAQVERRVSSEEMAAHPPGTTLPGFLISTVVVAPGGCYPTAAPGDYERDEDEIRAYLQAAQRPDNLEAYVSRTIRSVPEPAYLDAVATRLQPAPTPATP
jgi:glutaconate CoA-transferase subunit A